MLLLKQYFMHIVYYNQKTFQTFPFPVVKIITYYLMLKNIILRSMKINPKTVTFDSCTRGDPLLNVISLKINEQNYNNIIRVQVLFIITMSQKSTRNWKRTRILIKEFHVSRLKDSFGMENNTICFVFFYLCFFIKNKCVLP